MSQKPENPPAFPHLHVNVNESYSRAMLGGMTLRDYFAAAALQAIIGKIPLGETYEGGNHPRRREAATGAYHYATAMLKARDEV